MTTSPTQRPGLPRLANRVRAFHTKTSDGCKTCRIRRIKCDKTKPKCKRCSTTGRNCDGYPPSTPGSESSSHSLTPSTEHSSSSPPVLPISTNILETDQERRSFSFFCRHTFPQLSGSFDSDDFWQRLLQATHHEPAIRHAAVALGALHETFEAIPNTNLNFTLSEKRSHDVFAMQQYSKAIKALLGSNGGQEQAIDVALVTCVLFIYFEILRGHHATALSHINGGIKILSSLHPSPASSTTSPFPSPISQSSTPYVSTPTLTLLFIRFDTQASSIIANRQRILISPDLGNPFSGYTPEIPSEFRSLEEARNSLDYIRTEALRMMDTVDRSNRVKIKIMLACVQSTAGLRLGLWDRAFGSFVSRKKKEGSTKGGQIEGGVGTRETEKAWKDAINVLRVQRIFNSFFFCVDLERVLRDEGIWDEYTADFEEILRLSEAIIGPETPSSGNSEEVKRVLCLDAGIIMPLYFVATKCRIGAIRWKAIALLRRTERQEGLCNSVLTALVAERLVRIEEEQIVGGEIRTEDRVRGVELSLKVEERKASLRYARLERGAFGRPPPQEVEWIDGWICW
ncbi:hypothetical protein N431DRAFT_546736 [Stipitochalara longipes BDJ]|nr:hypothetical protein N431DRAFT_546736 [Stipitochalara longipes BDJ]